MNSSNKFVLVESYSSYDLVHGFDTIAQAASQAAHSASSLYAEELPIIVLLKTSPVDEDTQKEFSELFSAERDKCINHTRYSQEYNRIMHSELPKLEERIETINSIVDSGGSNHVVETLRDNTQRDLLVARERMKALELKLNLSEDDS